MHFLCDFIEEIKLSIKWEFNMNIRVWLGSALTLMLASNAAWADRPEVDCNALPEADVQRFYELSGEMSQAADEKRYEDALSLAKQAMSMCTSDTYTEYMLARLYDLTSDCASAFYHYEILDKRPSSVKSENGDIYKALPKHLKEVQKKCGDAATIEITCKTSETNLQIPGTSMNVVCPFYGKLKPGAYTIMATKNGYSPVKETITVSQEGGSFEIPELREIGASGFIRVRCPRGASKFVLTSSDGHVEEYVCPWEGEVAPDTYRIYLGGADPKTASVITVNQKDRVEHVIPSTSSSCSATPMTRTGSSAVLFAFLGLAGLAWGYRRRTSTVEK